MKTKKIIMYALMFLPLVVSLIALQFMPDQIPVHYGLNNQVNRWGSKYESLLLPAITLLFGFSMTGVAKLSSKQEKYGENNEKISITANILVLIFFNIMAGYFLYTSVFKIENLSSVEIDVNRLSFRIIGIFMIVIGNVMPKIRRNSFVGLRTRWSKKNETTWKKSQRFAGITFMAGGVVILLISFLLKGNACLLCSLVIFAILLFVDIWYTYKIAKKY